MIFLCGEFISSFFLLWKHITFISDYTYPSHNYIRGRWYVSSGQLAWGPGRSRNCPSSLYWSQPLAQACELIKATINIYWIDLNWRSKALMHVKSVWKALTTWKTIWLFEPWQWEREREEEGSIPEIVSSFLSEVIKRYTVEFLCKVGFCRLPLVQTFLNFH